MTTVIFKDGKMYGDKRITHYGIPRDNATTKVHKITKGLTDALFSFSGALSAFDKVKSWVENDMSTDLKAKKSEEFNALVWDGTDLFLIDPDGAMKIECREYVIGSGARYAMGAMAAGANPKKAIEIAARFDEATGPTVDTISL